MWRYDAGRTASSPDDLPSRLQLKWVREYTQRTQTWDDPLNNDLMQYDRLFEPIVMGDRVFFGFNDSDKVVCCDLHSGEELWRFYTDGPVRLPPAGHQDQVYVASDDGHLYCLSISDGSLRWKVRGGPSNKKVLGNRRVVSAWPARGGPVVRDGHVYFAASIWPFMGTFLYALDADTGEVVWLNDRTSAEYIKQPHSAPSFAGVAPQGALSATSDYLLVPGGRSVPAAFDRHTGELSHFHLNAGGKGTGGAFVMATDEHFYVHTRLRGVRRFDLESGKKTALMLNEPVLDGQRLITSTSHSVKAILSNEDGSQQEVIWELPVDGRGDLIRAGRRLYVAGANAISVLELASDSRSASVVDMIPTGQSVQRLVAGGDSLLGVTLDGTILCFGTVDEDRQPKRFERAQPADHAGRSDTTEFLRKHGAEEGFAIVFDVEDSGLIDDLIVNSDLAIVALSESEDVVQRLRRRYDGQGLYGTRVSIHAGTPESFAAPPYIAHLVVVASVDPEQYLTAARIKSMYSSVRPYGGVLWYPSLEDTSSLGNRVAQAKLASAAVHSEIGVHVERVGALTGSAPWTHLYGDIANTVKSDDQLVKAPLGILWFGGNSHEDVLPRHSHSPCEQVIGGQLFVEGVNSLTARDVYTGRVLWRRDFIDLGTRNIYFDKTYEDTPLSTKYNQVHIPGANARGTNFVATSDGIYVVYQDKCEILDNATGETRKTIVLPPQVNPTGTAHWTYVGIYKDALLAGVEYANQAYAPSIVEQITRVKKNRGEAWSPQLFASKRIAVIDRATGELRWHIEAQYGFLHNCIVAGRDTVFLVDKLPASVEKQRSRRGLPQPDDYRVLAVHASTGETRWSKGDQVFGTWLSYSEERDILLHAGAAAPDRALDEVGSGIVAYAGLTGELLWQNMGLSYAGPCIIHNDKVITNSKSYTVSSGVLNLTDGTPVLLDNPLTGQAEPWTYQRAYGCNTAVASEHLLTFRSGAAGYYDLNMKCGVANLGGFRSGCTSNLIAADGVLNAPDFTRTCSCGYQNQTSLALVHMEGVEIWTINPFQREADTDVRRIGINLGAAGTRRADDGTLWVEYPSASDNAAPVNVSIEGESVKYFRHHSSRSAGPLPWVTSSGVEGANTLVLDLTAIPPAAETESAESTDAETPDGASERSNESEEGSVEAAADGVSAYTVRLHLASAVGHAGTVEVRVNGHSTKVEAPHSGSTSVTIPGVSLQAGKIQVSMDETMRVSGVELTAD